MRKHLQLKINQLASKYADGSLSPRRVCRDALDDAVKLKTLNAFVRLTPEVAVQQAEESACRYQEEKQLGPMDGVPIAIKDNFCTRGIHTTCASKMLEDFVPPYNATVYERLLSAGAVLIGKTNMDEFAMGTGTVDSIFGPTKNVWSEDLSKDKWRISGGSSGGSATAVAAGICFAAIGSDTGGSTRNPASYCGIIGLKPTYGLVSRLGLIPLVNSMDVAGIFTRSVDDCVTVLNVIAGPDDKDSTTYHHPHQRIDLPELDQIDISKIRVGIPKEYQCKELSAEVLEIWQQVADMLESEGAQVRQVSLPHTEYCVGVYSVLNCGEVASNMARYDGIEYGHRANVNTNFQELVAKTQEEGFNQVVKDRIALGNFFLQRENYDRYYDKAMRVRRLILEDYQKVFTPAAEQDRVDVLLTPTTLSDAPLYKDFIAISSVDQCEVQDYCTIPANLAGVPAISLPIRLSKSGLPLSLQLISKSLNEKMLLTVCKWIEAKVEFNFLKNNQIVERANREDVA